LKYQKTFLIILSVLLLSSPLFSQEPAASAAQRPKIHFTVQPSIGTALGYTKYVMDLTGPIDSVTTGQLKSALKFPMNVAMGGVVVTMGPSVGTHGEWSVEASVFTNLNNPTKTMTDGDWMTVPNFSGEFSYTESDAQMTSIQLSLEGYKSVWRRGSAGLDIVGGIRYQKVRQKIMGFRGWQLDTTGAQVPVAGDGLVLTYGVSYVMPMIGLRAQTNAGRNVLVSASSSYLAVHASDDDNHILRTKVAKANGTGGGVLGKLSLRYLFGQEGARQLPFLDLSSEFVWIKAQTDQTQTWYGTDNGNAVPGTSLAGIPHTILSTQLQLTARLGMAF
jgi:hypothetical protein